ncbi:PLP-dependent aminotransferase family protein [Saxibacter everestensis]|uniref:PLP-dependent aminotransferase family protein n=1 Tax=Saxibacter everestensis TaxID=2909229 RepID=A0ABY8QQK4_9MICO|nr:PLP-dependent aminotransferase family protein [Brevibacteriaceae bacterium ZFBP1038]
MPAPLTSISARALARHLDDWLSHSGPAYMQLADRIRLLLLDGRLPAGTRLPAERDLASQLGKSRTTVTSAYRHLRERDYLQSRQGSGSVTCLPRSEPLSPGSSKEQSELLVFTTAASSAAGGLYEATQAALNCFPKYLSGPGYDLVGIDELRTAIAERYRTRGLPTAPEQIMVTLGAQHAITLLTKALLGSGDTALIEVPSYPHAFDSLRAATPRVVTTTVTSEGWDIDQLTTQLRRLRPALGYLMPDFHNPTSASMAAVDREYVLKCAARSGTTIIADETTAELNIDRTEVLLPMAAYGSAVLVGSVGKTVWGGLRVGWIRAEPELIERLVQLRHTLDLGTPILDQLVVAAMLERFDDILSEQSLRLRASRDLLVEEISRRFPEWQAPTVNGGLALWLQLGSPTSSALTLAARDRGLALTAGPRFGLDSAFERFLRLPFTYNQSQTLEALEILEAAWLAVKSRGPTASHARSGAAASKLRDVI